jgi:hypothetical protein
MAQLPPNRSLQRKLERRLRLASPSLSRNSSSVEFRCWATDPAPNQTCPSIRYCELPGHGQTSPSRFTDLAPHESRRSYSSCKITQLIDSVSATIGSSIWQNQSHEHGPTEYSLNLRLHWTLERYAFSLPQKRAPFKYH